METVAVDLRVEVESMPYFGLFLETVPPEKEEDVHDDPDAAGQDVCRVVCPLVGHGVHCDLADAPFVLCAAVMQTANLRFFRMLTVRVVPRGNEAQQACAAWLTKAVRCRRRKIT